MIKAFSSDNTGSGVKIIPFFSFPQIKCSVLLLAIELPNVPVLLVTVIWKDNVICKKTSDFDFRFPAWNPLVL